METPDNITKLIAAWRGGDQTAESALFDALYSKLRGIAISLLRTEQNARYMNATSVVHEAYLRFRKSERIEVANGAHFLALCARVMRHIITDRARARASTKHGGEFAQVEWNEGLAMTIPDAEEILSIDRAIQHLEEKNPRFAQLVELRYFAGYTNEEVGEILNISSRQVRRDWQAARVRLFESIHGTT